MQPAGLMRVALDAVAADQVEHPVGRATDQDHQSVARLETQPGAHAIRIQTRKGRHHQPAIVAGGAESRLAPPGQ